jgi:predicted enzyme related to lactoylglutathione lyase
MTNKISMFEIAGPNASNLAAFYDTLFQWDLKESQPGWWTTSEAGIDGGVLQMDNSFATFYVEVEDVEATLKDAAANGGRVVIGPITEGGVTFARLADPDGNLIGILCGRTS